MKRAAERDLCRKCWVELTTTDHEAQRCTQCDTKIEPPIAASLRASLKLAKGKQR